MSHLPYDAATKERVLARLLPPSPEPLRDVSISENISEPTLRKWLNESRMEGTLQGKTPEDNSGLTPQQKFQVVLETVTLDELQLGEYARSHGYFVQDIKRWIENCRQCNDTGQINQPGKVLYLQNELKQQKDTIRQLNQTIDAQRKKLAERDKALAEASSIILLQKKTWNLDDSTRNIS